MDDRRMLELAAKAAGITLRDYCTKFVTCYYTEQGSVWNPLTDDGDALRLAVKLGLIVDLRYRPGHKLANYNRVEYWLPPSGTGNSALMFEFGDHVDHNAATRRCIVRAAAAIGEQMEGK